MMKAALGGASCEERLEVARSPDNAASTYAALRGPLEKKAFELAISKYVLRVCGTGLR